MMFKSLPLVLTLSIIVVAAGCVVTHQPPDLLTQLLAQGRIQEVLKVGTTTQAQIFDAFGSPNITTSDGSGNEIWSYQRISRVSNVNTSDAGWLQPLVAAEQISSSAQSSRTLTLIIEFDKRNIVSDFRSRNSEY